MTIRAFNHADYEEKVLELAANDDELVDEATYYFHRNMERILGFRTLIQYITPAAEDSELMRRSKALFKNFAKWFLRERALRHIVNGKMKDQKQYIHYKNRVMLKFIERPQEWHSNRQDTATAKKKN